MSVFITVKVWWTLSKVEDGLQAKPKQLNVCPIGELFGFNS